MLQDNGRSWAGADRGERDWWTPYGERFPLVIDDGSPVGTVEIFTAMAGIHDAEARRGCEAALAAALWSRPESPGKIQAGLFGLYRVLLAHGGRRPPVVGLPLPLAALGGVSVIGGLDGEHTRWVRHHSMLRFIHKNLDGHFRRDADEITRVVTVQLENWTEGTIFSLSQAIAYAFSAHPEWRRAAVTWLLPHRDTWLRDYKRREPHVAVLARLAGKKVSVPGWLLSKAT